MSINLCDLPPDAELINFARSIAATKLTDPRWFERIKRVRDLINRPNNPRGVGLVRLETLLDHASRTVPFYSHIFTRTASTSDPLKLLQAFPVVSNSYLRDYLDEFVSTDYNPGQIEVTHSSGSTGRPTPHVKSLNDEYVINRALRNRLEKDLGISNDCEILDLSPRYYSSAGKPAEPIVTLDLGAGEQLTWRLRRFDARNFESVEEYCRFVSRPAELLYGAPSRFDGLIDYCKHSGWRPKFKGIVSTFEQLLPSMRKEYEKFFNCRLTNLYGTNETGFVGWECPAGSRMHVEEDFAFTEVLKTDSDEPVPEGELGRLVITSMKSWQMPIIRYDTGDLAAIREVRCICGHTTKIIERLEGRHSITFLGSDLSPIGPAHITDVLKRQDVPRFQVTQNKIGEIVINLGPNWTREALSRLGEELASEWEGLNGKLNIQMISEQFYYAPSGKFNLCVSFIPQTPSHVG